MPASRPLTFGVMLRPATLLVLILSLMTTAVSDAHARGAAPAVDRMIICAGMTTEVIHLDARGQPTVAPHHCPDCTLSIHDAVAVSPGCGLFPLVATPVRWAIAMYSIAFWERASATARGPPTLI